MKLVNLKLSGRKCIKTNKIFGPLQSIQTSLKILRLEKWKFYRDWIFYKFGTQIFRDEKLRRHRCICGDLRGLWSTNGAGAQTSLRRWGVKDEWAWTSGFGWRDKILQVLSLGFRWRKTLLRRDKTIEFWFWDFGEEIWTYLDKEIKQEQCLHIYWYWCRYCCQHQLSSFSSVLFVCCVCCIQYIQCNFEQHTNTR